jgi:hypothetical protein
MAPRKARSRTRESRTTSSLLLGNTRLRSGPFDNFPIGTLTAATGDCQPPDDGHLFRLWYSPVGRKPRALFRPLSSRE